MEQILKGFSHEKFKQSDKHVFKYTNDPKRFDFVRNQYEWLRNAKSNMPEYGFVFLTLIQEHDLCGYGMNRILDSKNIEVSDVQKILQGVKLIKDLTEDSMFNGDSDFYSYRNYIRKIILKNLDIFDFIDLEYYDNLLSQHTKFANSQISYCHGDLTTDNILKFGATNNLIFIDPNYRDDIWHSYLLDISKLYQETIFTNFKLFEEIKNQSQKLFNLTDEQMKFIDLLHISHYIRMIPYVQKYPELFKTKLARLRELYTLIK
jgi:hypothetical protein